MIWSQLLFVTSPPTHPNDLCGGFLLHLTLCFWEIRVYMARPQLFSLELWRKRCEKKLIQCLRMTIYVRVAWWRVTAHLTGFPSLLQMHSIEEATRGGTLLGGSHYFSITIETNTLAFSWPRPGLHWHQLSHHSQSWQTPKWTSALWIIPICTQFTHKMSRQQHAMTVGLHAWHRKVRGLLSGKTWALTCSDAVKKKNYSSSQFMMENATC